MNQRNIRFIREDYVKLEFRLIEDTPLYKKADTPHGISAILL